MGLRHGDTVLAVDGQEVNEEEFRLYVRRRSGETQEFLRHSFIGPW